MYYTYTWNNWRVEHLSDGMNGRKPILIVQSVELEQTTT